MVRKFDFPLPEVGRNVQLGDITAFPEPKGPLSKRFQVSNRQGLHDHFFGAPTEELLGLSMGEFGNRTPKKREWKLECDGSMFDKTIDEKEEWERGAESQLW